MPSLKSRSKETTLKKLDWELSKLDPKTPEYAAQRERIQNQKLEYQWHAMKRLTDFLWKTLIQPQTLGKLL